MDPFPPTEQQRAVITHRDGNLLVFAGPGTGKTETLARRFASIVADGIAPSRILVLTFSRRSADEMRDRVLLRLRQLHKTDLAVSELFVKTFHSFCGRLLEGDSRTQRGELLTPVKERLLWRRVMRPGAVSLSSFDAGVLESSQFATDCLNVIAHLKGQGVTAGALTAMAGSDDRLRDIAAVFRAMEAERARAGLRDYRDLVIEAVAALADRKGPAALWLRATGFMHVLVDEFQDSDRMQLRLLEAVRDTSSPAPLFCFVGDVNQSIYRFRGASPGNVEAAQVAFACQTLPLRDNRRCAQAILDVANADAALDPQSLTTAADPTLRGSVALVRPRTTDEEVRHIRDAVVSRIASGMAPRAIAVLLRQTRPYQELIIDAVAAAGVAVAALPSAGFHEDALVDAVLSALRLLAAPADERLWRRLLSNPILGYRPIDVRYAFDAGRRDHISDPRTMLATNAPAGVRPIEDFLKAWRRCTALYETAPALALVEAIIRELDLLRPVRERSGVKGFDLVASPLRLDALLQAAHDYSGEDGTTAGTSQAYVGEFIARLDETVGLLADASQPPASTIDGVRVMSIHAAKGLEFDFVVIPRLIAGILPASARPNRLLAGRSVRSLAERGISVFLDDGEARQEEHSLWYVALTRARSEVLATAAQVDDEGVDLQLSPFAAPIGEPRPAALPEVDTPESRSAEVAPGRQPSPAIRLPVESLSPTAIGSFIVCPRRFFYSNVLHLPARDDDATKYGLMLHRILARFHEIETDFTHVSDAEADATRYTRILGELTAQETGAAASTNGLGPLASFERGDLERRLGQYARALAYEAQADPFSVLACELPLRFSFAGITVNGKADRVDRLAGGGLVIRDYKSGRMGARLADSLRAVLGRIDEGESIFGDTPSGLNLQTVLYIPGAEETFAGKVRRLDFFYFRGKNVDDGDLRCDSTRIVETGEGDSQSVSRAEIARVESDIAAKIVAWCTSGEQRTFPTAHDDAPCRLCGFTSICPGPGEVAV